MLSLPCGLFLARLHEKDVAGFLPDDTPGGPRTETDAFFQSSRRVSGEESDAFFQACQAVEWAWRQGKRPPARRERLSACPAGFAAVECAAEVLNSLPLQLSSKEGVPASPQPHLDACSPDTTVGEVVERLAATHCTHVWVADGEGRLCGVVTPTDVLREASQASKAGEERFRMLKAIFEEQYAAVVEERDVATLSRLVGAMRGKVDEAS